MKKKSLHVLLVACFSIVALHATAQQKYSANRQSVTMTLYGTSNLHDWDMQMSDFSCDLTLLHRERYLQIQSVHCNGVPKSITSESSIMNRKTYHALQADKYQEISFRTSSPEIVPVHTALFEGTIAGDLFLAGRTGRITVPFSGKILSDEKIQVSGSKKIRMSDYNIDPPTALLGTLRTGDEVTVSFNLVLKKAYE